ncbi:3-hydroxyacyl-CoA dehydrogenase NAD-binding domain-containing protein [Rhodococcoides kyotonense]|uniref:enoyl-CoA hydratase n=1 Tax=Rhodococcoides kyotonense TaxID=398843 RepID=A0A239H9B3_9NOCA|nr:3-hydroxyacyl-CoA dehydrogenase NAD-binding domain-containing protein [Rhodococcus kyotonensis]SNS77950.1 3-hydroxyacyl-CoA dehydrogenase / enoyl-CoA hydratase / 3-hydroxybutyryl-CoA epimerase [Rhodococcus kyotonensis]
MTDNMIGWDRDADGIVVLTMDDPHKGANTMNDLYIESMAATVDRLEAEKDSITGVVVTSAKKSFFAGGDLGDMTADPAGSDRNEIATALTHRIDGIKTVLRRLETLGRPVVSAINGAALGGGFEIALHSHYRVAANIRGVQIGLPEVTLGLLPGGGGITRVVRLMGLQAALPDVLLKGKRSSPAEALELGLIDEIVESVAELIPAAKAWVLNNPTATQPWDGKGFTIPGGSPADPAVAQNLLVSTSMLRKRTKGAPAPAPRAIVAAAVEGAYVDVDTADRIETRYFVSLVTDRVAQNMINAFFFDKETIDRGKSRPEGYDSFVPAKVGIIGAGMMGSAIAYVCARAGVDVVLKDVDIASAERGKDYARKLEDTALARGTTTAAKSEATLARITPTADAAQFAGVDLVVEAAFESVDVKHSVFREIENIVEPDAVLGTNTSQLPIAVLAEGVQRAEDFIGIHFFSPVDKMPLVEIVRGEKTSDAALAKVVDFVHLIRKTPIVVNDSRGFFTSRVIGTFLDEAMAAVGEGVDPTFIEQAGAQAGYPAPPLQLMDEVTLTLSQKIRHENARVRAEAGHPPRQHGSDDVMNTMVEGLSRAGRSGGGGFYSYDDSGKRTGIWTGVREAFSSGTTRIPMVDMQERMLFAESIEAVKCFDEGVLTSVEEANIGSLLGIGFPSWTGGVIRYIEQYDGGIAGFVERARELAARYGDRFEPPKSLVAMAVSGERKFVLPL